MKSFDLNTVDKNLNSRQLVLEYCQTDNEFEFMIYLINKIGMEHLELMYKRAGIDSLIQKEG